MLEGPVIARVAALIGEPARANMLTALLDGRALTVSELARAAGVALPTASGHLAKLSEAGLLAAEKQGRHRYFRLSGPDVGEQDLAVTAPGRAFLADFGIDLATLERARRPLCRSCLDWSERRSHLGGSLGAALLERLVARGWVAHGGGRVLVVTPAGRSGFERLLLA